MRCSCATITTRICSPVGAPLACFRERIETATVPAGERARRACSERARGLPVSEGPAPTPRFGKHVYRKRLVREESWCARSRLAAACGTSADRELGPRPLDRRRDARGAPMRNLAIVLALLLLPLS